MWEGGDYRPPFQSWVWGPPAQGARPGQEVGVSPYLSQVYPEADGAAMGNRPSGVPTARTWPLRGPVTATPFPGLWLKHFN